jgi:hypothetical protein
MVARKESTVPKFRELLQTVALATILLTPPGLRAASKPILVHYMPWFVAKPYSDSWGWHWTMNHFDPDTVDLAGRRQIASWYYPQTGPYDSGDPVVLEYHCLLMKLAGIDGVIVDWYGKDNYLDYGVNDLRTRALLKQTQLAGLSFALCYEDITIQREIDGGYISASAAIAQTQATLRYAETNYFSSANYLRLHNRPVLLNFGPQYFKTNSQWVSVFSALNDSNPPAFFTENQRLPVGLGAFDWPPMWLSPNAGSVLSTAALEGYLASFQQSAASWPAFISSAFPRFHDIYQEAGAGSSYGLLADNDGGTFRSTLSRALTNNSALVQLVTWNDFGEGTVIKPTLEFGTRDLVTLQDARRQLLDSAFPYRFEDLNLPLRLYQLRRQHPTNAILSAELDRVSANIVSGDLALANLQLTAVEAKVPVIYNPALTGGSLQFQVGGYVPSDGEIQTTLNLVQPEWTTVQTFTSTTNPMILATPVSSQAGPAFFRLRVPGP